MCSVAHMGWLSMHAPVQITCLWKSLTCTWGHESGVCAGPCSREPSCMDAVFQLSPFLLLKYQIDLPNSCAVFQFILEAYIFQTLYIPVHSPYGLFWLWLLMSMLSVGRILLLSYPEVMLSFGSSLLEP